MAKKKDFQGTETYTRTPTRSYIRNSASWQERPMSGSGPITERVAVDRGAASLSKPGAKARKTLTPRKKKKKPGAMVGYIKRRNEAASYE